MRVEIFVRPGATVTRVGGDHDGLLVVSVRAPARQGAATKAALAALADALGLPRAAVTLVRGATSRRKLVDVATKGPGGDALAAQRLALLATGSDGAPAVTSGPS